ncbi:right-handed parallel beta-helix repeat-containing protein [Bacillus rhizoplanae]|uniref:right-handed parallel beta-helix repeat-containing protein n=1 Tax=Bacillus rhizoplanae TaxID=2880966 RepID=UPI003D1C3F88
MKTTRVFFLFCTLFLSLSLHTHAQDTLQSQINAAPEYGIVKIPSGIYNETIVLSRPITLEGTGEVTVRSCSKEPAITIKGQSVTLKHIKVEQCSDVTDTEAIRVTGKNHRLHNLRIYTKQFGIKFNEASDTVVEDSFIRGDSKGNGIDLWESNNNMIQGVEIDGVRDGIYIENSHFNQVTQNAIRNSRYGVHIMFSNHITVQNNKSHHNITGAMVMGTKETTIKKNDFSFNNRNVNAQGLLLYDAENTEAIDNRISYNRVGMYVENANNNRISDNEVNGNFIGMQFKNANENNVSDNVFIGNVNESQAINSTGNKIIHNYWDASLKLDTKRNGISSIPYRADPFFLTLTNEVPEYQLFFQAPGMLVLQTLLKSPENQVLTDYEPAMIIRGKKVENNSSFKMQIGMISVSMLAISITLFKIGRKRR